MRIGIDVGGTNTDAALMDGPDVVSWTKQTTTENVTDGVTAALSSVLASAKVSPDDITAVMIGTTHFTNAVVERRGLDRTAVIRLGLPATQSIPPLTDWPDDLREAIGGIHRILHGGHQYDGREISSLDDAELVAEARTLQKEGVQSLVISSVFSPATPQHEQRAAERFSAVLAEVPITLSHQIGRLGLLERENASALNACLASMAQRTLQAFERALEAQGISAPLYLSQNDGTLMTAEFSKRYPVLTFASGPTNSMRGAAALSELSDAVVVDIGGTTTDAGMLVNGFPREASFEVEIGGVRTNFRMPDVVSIGLGGGSHVSDDGRSVGPLSVGYRLTEESRIFGGSQLTASDIAVAAGRTDFGNAQNVANLEPSLVYQAVDTIDRKLAELIDSVKTAPGPIPVIVVGGGAVLVADRLEGASRVVRPHYAGIANAIGAAIAQVSGEIDRIFSLENRSRDSALAEARRGAIWQAVEAGAEAETVEIVEVDEVPLAYLPSNALRLRVKAVGDLRG